MPRYKPHQIFYQKIKVGYPLIDDNDNFVLNDIGEKVIGLEIDAIIESGHPKSKKCHMYISKHQLLLMRRIIDDAIYDLYDGEPMSTTFSSDLI